MDSLSHGLNFRSAFLPNCTVVYQLIYDLFLFFNSVSYEILQVSPAYVDDRKTTRGAMSYLTSGEADLMATPAVMSNERFKKMSSPHPWLLTPMNLMIPTPQPSMQIKAVIQPYSSQVIDLPSMCRIHIDTRSK